MTGLVPAIHIFGPRPNETRNVTDVIPLLARAVPLIYPYEHIFRPRTEPSRMPVLRLLALPFLLALLAAPAAARDPVVLAGAGKEVALSLDALRALEPQTHEVAFLTSKGEETGRYTGAKLWDILAGNGLIDPNAHGALLRSLVIVTAGDGYTLVLSAGELAPDLGNKPVLLAYARDGAALDAGRSPRLIVPGDARGARNVRDVARIEVRLFDASATEKAP